MNGWKTKKLREVSAVFEDGDWIESKDQSVGGVRLIQTGNIGNGFFKDRGEKARYISEDTFKRLRCTEIAKGDCLISRLPDPVGRACIIPNTGEKMITAVDCTIVRFQQKEILPEWFIYFSLSNTYHNEILKQVTGATRQRISRKKLGLIDVPIPPLSEQQRILRILAEALNAVSKARNNSEKNLKNAKELFESYLQSLFENKREDWEEKSLKEITSLLGDGLHGTPKYTEDGDYYFVNGNNLDNGKITFKNNTKKVSILEYEKYKKKLNDRTILVSINGTLGNVAFYNDEKIILGKSACYFNLNDGVDKNFIKYIISSPYYLKYAHREATGATIKNVSLKTMREFKVPLPSLSEQQVIVQKLDAISTETKKLEVIYQQKLNDLEELKKSVLQKAFAGELLN